MDTRLEEFLLSQTLTSFHSFKNVIIKYKNVINHYITLNQTKHEVNSFRRKYKKHNIINLAYIFINF